MDNRFRYEVSVGLFVIAAALILGYMSLKLSRAKVRDGLDVRVRFAHACGLVKDAPVTVAGVEVGYVKGLGLDSGRALITARIRRDAGLRRDIKATIRSKSLLGEPYLELIPSDGNAPPLREGEMITDTSTPVQIDQLVAWLGTLTARIDPDDAGRLLKSLAADPEATRRIVKNLDTLLVRLSSLDAPALKEFIRQLKINARFF
ncbi:MAG: MlaD family protein [Candidatus Aureabacteria bacterium]|nr:MlaD family protein [Candidatus Auribacterota bacterium]